MVKHGRNKQSKQTSSTCLALQVVFGRACGAASTTFQIEKTKNPTSNKDSETSPKKRQNHCKSNPKMTLTWPQNGAKSGPRTTPETLRKEIRTRKLILSFWVVKKLQNGSHKLPKNYKKQILEPFENTPKNIIFQELFLFVFGATQEVPDPENQAKTF